tara:strand:+ start:551 stop:787 length:237 start_codon:yes stop_codon:yes gene_type:complete
MKYTWWIIQSVLILVSVFFLLFGIDLLMAAYGFKDPFNFLMTFFAASFIILISLALALGFLIKMIRVWRRLKNHPAEN